MMVSRLLPPPQYHTASRLSLHNFSSPLLPQKMLTDVWTKFRLFQKPANFDTRLAECERLLAGVKSQVGVLDIRSVEQDVVQSQLDQCMVGHIAPDQLS